MSATRDHKKHPKYCKLSAMVNFGPEKQEFQPEKADINTRVKEIIKRLSDINTRIDRLAQKP